MNASRRYFLQRIASAVAGSIVLPVASHGFPGKKRPGKIGVQLFSIPKITEKDFAGTMQRLAEIGFKEIEFYGPYSFSAPEDQQRWDSVTPSLGFSGSGFFGLTTKQVKKILDDNGLSAPSMHTGLASLKSAIDQLAEAAELAELAAQGADLLLERAQAKNVGENRPETPVVQRLGEVVEGTQSQGFDRGIDRRHA